VLVDASPIVSAVAIVEAGDLVLRRRAEPVAEGAIGSTEISELIDAMATALSDAGGVGLAAPQIGVPLRVVLVQDPPEFHTDIPSEVLVERERTEIPPYVLINPELELVGEETRTFFEGCLSIDGYCGLVPRARSVRVRWLDPSGTRHDAVRTGWHARILQHEIDHLEGVLYVDRVLTRTFMTTRQYRAWAQQPPDAVRHAFGA
jgi:peptide deformylase